MENFNTAYYLIDLQYGVDLDQDDFEELGLLAWNKIGNKITRLYRIKSKINKEELSIELPCNCDYIEAVTTHSEDAIRTGPLKNAGDYKAANVEAYIEGRKTNKNPLYIGGKYAKFQKIDNKLYFEEDYGTVNILYHGIYVDDEGLPYITETEKNAIACYCALSKKFKEGFSTNNGNIIQMAQLLEQKWIQLKQKARQPIYLTQNDMNEILDARTSWNRKLFDKSYKPVK